jgi:hypothetical protein
MIKRICSDQGSEDISNEFKDVLITSGKIYELLPSYSPESNRIAEDFNQIFHTIARSMTSAAPNSSLPRG